MELVVIPSIILPPFLNIIFCSLFFLILTLIKYLLISYMSIQVTSTLLVICTTEETLILKQICSLHSSTFILPAQENCHKYQFFSFTFTLLSPSSAFRLIHWLLLVKTVLEWTSTLFHRKFNLLKCRYCT